MTVECLSYERRSGTICDFDGLLEPSLGDSLQKGIEEREPNPDLPFAGTYSVCHHGALENATWIQHGTATVRTLLNLVEDDQSGDGIIVELHAHDPNLNLVDVERVMKKAYPTFPYSKALRGKNLVTLVVIQNESNY